MAVLPDGIYDVIVVDAESSPDGEVLIEVTITLGPHLGNLIKLRKKNLRAHSSVLDDPLTLLGIPGTMKVSDGEPSFRPDT